MENPHVIAITGASGLVGQALVSHLEAEGLLVRQLVRREVRDSEREIYWNPSTGEIDAAELNGVDAVVHLAGESVAAGRWTKAKKQRIVDSRVEGTRLLSQTLAGLTSKPAVLCSASAIGFYGDRGDQLLNEDAPPGEGFLADTCQLWEAAADPARDAGIRTVHMRIGLVLSPDGGALGKMLPLFKCGLGGVLGSGQQFMSWITLDDLVSAFHHALTHSQLAGPVNGVAPGPVTNREFTKTLGRVLGRPTILPAPAFALRLALGEMADQLLLASARVDPAVLQTAGFEFGQTQLEPALRDLLAR